MSREPSKFMQWLSKLIPQTNGVSNLTPSEQKRTLKEEDFQAVGVHYYKSNINKLACSNPEWKKSAAQIAKDGRAGKRIFRYNYVNKPVKLQEEPDNPHDSNAVAVIIAGELVGYISREENIKVKQILKNREIISLSAFIKGGDYKVIEDDGTTFKDSKGLSVNVRIKYI